MDPNNSVIKRLWCMCTILCYSVNIKSSGPLGLLGIYNICKNSSTFFFFFIIPQEQTQSNSGFLKNLDFKIP